MKDTHLYRTPVVQYSKYFNLRISHKFINQPQSTVLDGKFEFTCQANGEKLDDSPQACVKETSEATQTHNLYLIKSTPKTSLFES